MEALGWFFLSSWISSAVVTVLFTQAWPFFFFFSCSEPQLSGFLVSAACLFLLCRAGLGRAVYGVVVVIWGLWGGELLWGGMWISLIQQGPCMNVGALWG